MASRRRQEVGRMTYEGVARFATEIFIGQRSTSLLASQMYPMDDDDVVPACIYAYSM